MTGPVQDFHYCIAQPKTQLLKDEAYSVQVHDVPGKLTLAL